MSYVTRHIGFRDAIAVRAFEALDEENEEEEDDLDFDIDGLKSKLPRKQHVTIVLESGRSLTVETNVFLWPFQWMRAQIKVYPGNLAAMMEKEWFYVTEYCLDESSGRTDGVSVISLFLTSLTDERFRSLRMQEAAQKDFRKQIQAFSTFLRKESKTADHLISLDNLDNLVEEYIAASVPTDDVAAEQYRGGQADEIRFRLRRSRKFGGNAAVLALARYAPEFFKVASLLLPRKIQTILERNDDLLLQKLNQVTVEEPWKFAFSELMFDLTRLSGLEASLHDIRKAPFYEGLEQVQKNSIHLYNMIKDKCFRDGHTYLEEAQIKKMNNSVKKTNAYKSNPLNAKDISEALRFLTQPSLEVLMTDHGANGKLRYHLRRYWRAEETISTGFATLVSSHANWRLEGVDLSCDDFDSIRTDKRQVAAAHKIINNPITVVSGRGGTGKTEVVLKVLNKALPFLASQLKETEKKEQLKKAEKNEQLEKTEKKEQLDKEERAENVAVKNDEEADKGDEENPENDKKKAKPKPDKTVLYTAPTGRSAAVIRRRIGKKAFTIHQVLASYRTFKGSVSKAEPDSERRWKFRNTMVLVVDESSMVPLELFSWLLSCLLRESRLRKVVLLGDVHQLPSIDPGNFMEDLVDALEPRGFTVRLLTNHRSEGDLIFSNASRIIEHKLPIFDSLRGFHMLLPESERFSPVPDELEDGVEHLQRDDNPTHRIPLRFDKMEEDMEEGKKEIYRSLLWNHRERFELTNPGNSQLIEFRRKECSVLNEYCTLIYNNHRVFERRPNSFRWSRLFLTGDKVMATKNEDIFTYRMLEKEAEEVQSVTRLSIRKERIMNGSVYLIQGIGYASNDLILYPSGVGPKSFFKLDDLTNELLLPDKNHFLSKSRPQHAFCLSIHKCQGSEFDTVVYGVAGIKFETWQHVYTAVTRAKRRVVVVATDWQLLLRAVMRDPIKRQTTLKERMLKCLKRKNEEEEEGWSKKTRVEESDEDECFEEKTKVEESDEELLWGDEDDSWMI